MPLKIQNSSIPSVMVGATAISKIFRGGEIVFHKLPAGYVELESVTSTRSAKQIKGTFYMNHRYVTDIQFSNDVSEMTSQKRILRPVNLGGNSGGTYWEGTFANYTTGQYALGGGVYVPTTAGFPSDRNKVLWYYDEASTTMNISINGISARRTRSGGNPTQGYDVRGIVDNVGDYSGKQTIFRETEYNEDMTRVLHDFVPARRLSDGRIGFYDIITNEFRCAANNTGLTGNELPITGYTELQYAQLNGDTWFNTGVKSVDGYKFLIDATVVNTTISSIGVNGTTPNWINITNGYIQSFSNTDLVRVAAGDHINYGLELYSSKSSTAFAMNLTQGSTKTITHSSSGATVNVDIHFIKLTNVATSNAVIKVHDFRIWRKGVLVRDFIPVKRNSDGKIGFFDTVERKFYINQGANDFTAGPNK